MATVAVQNGYREVFFKAVVPFFLLLIGALLASFRKDVEAVERKLEVHEEAKAHIGTQVMLGEIRAEIRELRLLEEWAHGKPEAP